MYKIFKDVFLNIPNDRLKLIIGKFLNNKDEAELIASLHSDDLKIRYIKKIISLIVVMLIGIWK